MKLNKTNTNAQILNLTTSQTKTCVKLSMANIVMPSLDEQGLMAYVFPGMVITKEQPMGCYYGPNSSTVLRILGGQLLRDNMADSYAWDAATYAKKAAKSVPIGFGYGATTESVKWAMEIVNSVKDPNERDLLIKFFIEQPALRLIFSKEETRTCIEVTEELFSNGLQFVVDEWMSTDKNGLADATTLNVGDFLIVTDTGYYCIRREEFLSTHTC